VSPQVLQKGFPVARVRHHFKWSNHRGQTRRKADKKIRQKFGLRSHQYVISIKRKGRKEGRHLVMQGCKKWKLGMFMYILGHIYINSVKLHMDTGFNEIKIHGFATDVFVEGEGSPNL
jgi:hypothetical protein